MKILFLDIDGVLNSETWMLSLPREELLARQKSHDLFDPQAVARLNKIIETSGAKVVLSSSWRHTCYCTKPFCHGPHSWKELLEIIERNGVVADIIDRTPLKMSFVPRGVEIKMWLENASGSIESIVILDDDSDMFDLSPRHVQTTWKQGLLDCHIQPALDLLDQLF